MQQEAAIHHFGQFGASLLELPRHYSIYAGKEEV